MTEASSNLLPVISAENKLSPDVEKVANFFQESGLNNFPKLFELHQASEGFSLGLSRDTCRTLHLNNHEEASPWLLEQVSLGTNEKHQVLVVTQLVDNKKVIGGYFTVYQQFFPTKTSSESPNNLNDLSLGQFNASIDATHSLSAESINAELNKIEHIREKLRSSGPLSVDSIQNSDWQQVAKTVLSRAELHPEWQPSLEELQALLCVAKVVEVGYIPDNVDETSDWVDDGWDEESDNQNESSVRTYDDEPTPASSPWSTKDLPWPTQSNTDLVILSEIDTSIVEPPTQPNTGYHGHDRMLVASSPFGDVISDPYGDEYKSPLQLPIEIALTKADQATRVEFFKWYFEHYYDFNGGFTNPGFYRFITQAIKIHVPITSDFCTTIGESILRKISDLDTSHLQLDSKVRGTSEDWEFFFDLDEFGFGEYALIGLSSENLTETEKHQTESIILQDKPSIARFINLYRHVIDKLEPHDKRRQILEARLRNILGIPEDADTHTHLEDVYQKVNFSEYHKNEVTAEVRTSRVKAILEKYIHTTDRVLSLACGTGWFTQKLKDLGYPHILGIDISDTNLAHARSSYPDINFVKGSWYDPLPAGSNFDHLATLSSEAGISKQSKTDSDGGIRAIEITGWSLTHAEDSHNYRRIIDNIATVQNEGDIVIFDTNDPTKPPYQERIQANRGILSRYGFSSEKLGKMWYLVDGPPDREGKISHFYNRFMPPIDWQIYTWEQAGYELVERFDDARPDNPEEISTTLAFKKKFDGRPSPEDISKIANAGLQQPDPRSKLVI